LSGQRNLGEKRHRADLTPLTHERLKSGWEKLGEQSAEEGTKDAKANG
jgi:hypothetical protein